MYKVCLPKQYQVEHEFKMQIFNLVGTIRVWNDLQIVHAVSKSRLVIQMNIRFPRVIKTKGPKQDS
jgi:hypothetical protein